MSADHIATVRKALTMLRYPSDPFGREAMAALDALAADLEQAKGLLLAVYHDEDERDNRWFMRVEKLFPEAFANNEGGAA